MKPHFFETLVSDLFLGKTEDELLAKLAKLSASDLDYLMGANNEVHTEVHNKISILHIFVLSLPIFKWLVEKGGNPFIEDNFGKKPLDLLNPDVDTEAYQKLKEYLDKYLEKKELEEKLTQLSNESHDHHKI